MPAPSTVTYSAAAISAANTALLGKIDAGAGPGKVRLYDDLDNLLADVTLSDPAGTVDAGTGQLTVTAAAPGDVTTSGLCTYGVVVDSDNTPIVSVPAVQGSSADPGKLVISDTTLLVGAQVELLSFVVG